AETGERVVLRAGDASLACAIAASTAVPGVLPVVDVAGRRLMDGGVASITNADGARAALRGGGARGRACRRRTLAPAASGKFALLRPLAR
ncbi:MAG: patatin-like phospholipase family protein, partial [Opitutaceae bacterium]